MRVFLIGVHRPELVHKATEQAVMLVAKDLGMSPAGASQLTSRCSTFPARGPSTGRPFRAAAYFSVSWVALGRFGWFGAIGPWPVSGSKTRINGVLPRPSKFVVLLVAQRIMVLV